LLKPLIAVSTSRDDTFASGSRDFARFVYVQALDRAGALAVLLPNHPSSEEVLAYCHGLLLTGGGDYDPALYGQEPQGTHMASVNPARDQAEQRLIAAALNRNMPVFGICRGMQGLAIAGGGTLVQDIEERLGIPRHRHAQHQGRSDRTHRVHLEGDSVLARLVGVKDIEVNSFHHQSVDRLPRGYRLTARSDDGLVEAFEDPGHTFVVGVQWHPEDLAATDRSAQQLFQGFVDAARAYRESQLMSGQGT
jgi:putative glutamine amidotransferase